MPRRAFALGCAAVASAWALSGCAAGASPEQGAPFPAQLGFWFEPARCIGCASCAAACQEASGTPDGATPRRRVFLYRFADGRERFLSYSCMHCGTPVCAEVCPAGAITKGGGGAVTVDKGRCIGCRYCREACPFHVPNYLASGMDKCDLCLGAGVSLGNVPYCVLACPTHALHYGTLGELAAASGARPMDAPGDPSFILT